MTFICRTVVETHGLICRCSYLSSSASTGDGCWIVGKFPRGLLIKLSQIRSDVKVSKLASSCPVQVLFTFVIASEKVGDGL